MASISAIIPTILLILTTSASCERWARQIPTNGFGGASPNDWIPVPCPTCKSSDRQQGARVLNYVAQASNQQQQFIQNVIPHQKQWQHPKVAFNEEPMRLVSQGYLVPPEPNQQQFGFVNQYPQFAYQHENQQQYLHRVPIPQVNNLQYEYIQQPQLSEQIQQSVSQPLAEALIMQKPQVFEKNEIQQHINQLPQQPTHQPEEVQLLYVPLDTLYQQNQYQGNEANQNNLIPTNVNPHQINNFYTAGPVISSTPASSMSVPLYHSTETPSLHERAKVKSNQPPLAMFMKNKVKHSDISVNEVLNALKNSKNIDVLDSSSKKSPKIFVGPSGLTPEGYTKFELPYLSSIEQDRPNRQVNSLPFFVAPLSYRAPNGFAKIPLPSPHVGSVVVNTPDRAINSESSFSQRQPNFYQPTDFQTQHFYEQNFDFFNPTGVTITNIPSTSTTRPTKTNVPTTRSTTNIPITRSTTNIPTARSTTVRTTTAMRPIQRHTTGKPNLGFRFGSNVFSSTAQPYQSAYEHTEVPEQPYRNEYNQARVSSTTEKNFEYNKGQESFNSRQPVSSTTDSPLAFFNKYFNFGTTAVSISSSTDRDFEYINRGQAIDNSRSKEQDFSKHSNLDAYKIFNPFPTSHVTNEEYFNIDDKDLMRTILFNRNLEQHSKNTSQTHFIPSNAPHDYPNFRNKYNNDEESKISNEKKVEDSFQTQTVKPIEYSTKAQEILKMKSHFREQNSQHTRPNLPATTESITQQTFSYTPVTISYENLLKPLSSTTNYDFFDSIKNPVESNLEVRPAKMSYFTPTPNYDEESSNKQKKGESVKYFKYSIIDSTNNPPESSKSYKSGDETIIENQNRKPVSNLHEDDNNKHWEINSAYNGPSTLRPVIQSLPGLINGLMDETSEKNQISTTETVVIPRRSPTRRRRPDTTQTPITTSTDNSAKRTAFRGRRPIHYANRTTTVRTTIARNTNRVRYNPTPDERQQLRNQTKKESENLEYQRDVLKQNYPVSRNPSSEAPAIVLLPVAPTIEKLSSSYFVEDGAQKIDLDNEYVVVNERENISSKEEDATAIPVTTLSPVPSERPNFRQPIRKTQRHYSSTTTSSPADSTTQIYGRPSRERYTVRPRSRFEATTQQTRTTKRRNDLRQRRPTTTRAPASSTVSGMDELSSKNSNQQISRFNTDFYQEATPASTNYRGGNEQKNHRYSGSHFGLKSEETRWSVKTNQSSFQPIDPEVNVEEDSFEENEPMIVTAQTFSEHDLQSFSIPVKQSFDFSQGSAAKEKKLTTTQQPNQDSPMEILFEDLFNEIITDNKKNEIKEETEDTKLASNHKNTVTETNVEKKSQRRGVWKRIRVRPLDAFETAESQNYGQQYFNQISDVDTKAEKFEKVEQHNLGVTSTPEVITTKSEVETTSHIEKVEPNTGVPVVLENETVSTSTTTEFEKISTTEVALEVITTLIPEVDQSNSFTTIRPTENKIDETTKLSYDNNANQITERNTEIPYYDDYDTERIFTERRNENSEEDQEPQSSNILSEVKQKLTDLFAFDSEYDYQENNLPLKMQQYTTIERNKSANRIPDEDSDIKLIKSVEVVTEPTSLFHKNLMDSVIYATSTSTEVSHETEICYRGRCIKTDKLKT